MKTITIGRGEKCDIFIDDYRISRQHAVLKVYTFGKMEIVDMGQNGTWVNGVKLRPGVPFPVKRKDVVNFAEASQLNWTLVENPLKYIRIVGLLIGVLLLSGLFVLLISSTLLEPSPMYDNSIESSVNAGPSVGNNIVSDSIKGSDSPQSEKNDTVIRKEKDRYTPRTIKELFPQGSPSKKDSASPQKEGKNKEKAKLKNNKKVEEKEPVYDIL